jgi:hypothetical protein
MVTPDNSPPPLPPPPLPQQQRATTAVDGNGSRTKTSPPAARNALPDRNVDGDSLEDAYVSFIYYCNPALPADADVAALREAFRNPPKSGGKSFSSFAIYQLVRQFYQKEIKTWTDLTIKLGVEPPDPTRDESAQKITQYGVRLKVRKYSSVGRERI